MGWTRGVALLALALGVGGLGTGCGTTQGARREHVAYPPDVVRGDPALAALNAEELLAEGRAALAAEDWPRAERHLTRLADGLPDSPRRAEALYPLGLALQRQKKWEAALARFQERADPARGTGEALEASFRAAECLYQLDRFAEAAALLRGLARREDLPAGRRLEAQVQQGICELEGGGRPEAEATLRAALDTYAKLPDPREVDAYYPAQAQFFLGELYRLAFEEVTLTPGEGGVEALVRDLEHKAELLLSAQGHYLRAIRRGHGYWATAAGAQIGLLYETLHAQLVNAPTPAGLDAEQAEAYRQEVRGRVRVLLTKAISVYESTLEAAERIGSQNAFVERTRQSLEKVKQLLLADETP